MFKLSLILPVYNEETEVHRTLDAVFALARQRPDMEFIFVDDGSKDHTAEHIDDRLRKENGHNLRLLALQQNAGKGHAVREGFTAATGDLLCFTDGDLPYSLDQVLTLERELSNEGIDIVIGSRNVPAAFNVEVPLRRRLLGTTFNAIVRCAMGLPYLDTQAGLKGFRRAAAHAIFPRLRTLGFSFDVEVLYLAKKSGHRVLEIPVRVSGEHNYKTSKLKLLKDSLRMFLEICRIRLNDFFGAYRER